jgi:inorganic pyrophosphatase
MVGDRFSFTHRAHPWHGVATGPDPPRVVTAYVEIVPTDTVKYEMDKATGILRIDRPQQYSNVCPSLYGFIPRTLCAERVGELCASRTGRAGVVGDGDPMDVCVLTEKTITHGDILITAIPIGGLRMIDGDQADDKIIAVLQRDEVHGALRDIGECPLALLDRLRHYFLTYKQSPDLPARRVEIAAVYGRDEAHEAIERSRQDYRAHFPDHG